eukprot:GILJ01001438.1.p1 GENE.GILJ01001438.1~~GILJ01001438.1.p1  ORF type:complete len:791 (+),score=86.84 GILJ01001438.1:264-2375(+)
MRFNAGLTFLSFVLAVLIIFLGFVLSGMPDNVSPRRIAVAGTTIGLGVAAMHYTGMLAMAMDDVSLVWNGGIIFASILIGCIAASAALVIFYFLRKQMKVTIWLQLACSAVMGIAVCGMHYTGMQAATFVMDPSARSPEGSVSSDVLTICVIVLSVSTCLIMWFSIFRMQTRVRRQNHTKKNILLSIFIVDKHNRVLTTTLGNLPNTEIAAGQSDVTEEDLLWMSACSRAWECTDDLTHPSNIHFKYYTGKTKPVGAPLYMTESESRYSEMPAPTKVVPFRSIKSASGSHLSFNVSSNSVVPLMPRKVVVKQKFIEAVNHLADRLGLTSLAELGVLYPAVITLNHESKTSASSSEEQSQDESVMLVLVKRTDDADKLVASGDFRFSSFNILDPILKKMHPSCSEPEWPQDCLDYLQALRGEALAPGLYLTMLHAASSAKGAYVMVENNSRHMTPIVKISDQYDLNLDDKAFLKRVQLAGEISGEDLGERPLAVELKTAVQSLNHVLGSHTHISLRRLRVDHMFSIGSRSNVRVLCIDNVQELTNGQLPFGYDPVIWKLIPLSLFELLHGNAFDPNSYWAFHKKMFSLNKMKYEAMQMGLIGACQTIDEQMELAMAKREKERWVTWFFKNRAIFANPQSASPPLLDRSSTPPSQLNICLSSPYPESRNDSPYASESIQEPAQTLPPHDNSFSAVGPCVSVVVQS